MTKATQSTAQETLSTKKTTKSKTTKNTETTKPKTAKVSKTTKPKATKKAETTKRKASKSSPKKNTTQKNNDATSDSSVELLDTEINADGSFEEEEEDLNDPLLDEGDIIELNPEGDDAEQDENSVSSNKPAVFLPYPTEKTRSSLHIYLQEINRFPMLKPEEELMLAMRVKETGDPDAAFKLISSHLRLVVRIATDFQRRWMQNVLDLIQEGNVGLVRAVSKFDPEKGIKFSYYATFWIKAYILKFIMDNWRMVKIGTTQTQRKLFYNLNKERQQLISQGFDPDAKMLADRLGTTEDKIVEMQQRLDASDFSLDAPVSDEDGGGRTRVELLPALEAGIEEVLGNDQIASLVRERLESLTPKLSDKERYLLENRLLTDDPITLREIGEHFSITRERVRQVEARLLQKIRDHLFNHIKDFSIDWIEQ